MPTEYVLLTISVDHRDAKPTKVLITNYKFGKVIGKHIGSSKQCGSHQLVEQISMESTKKY
jgi:hypothetical protein